MCPLVSRLTLALFEDLGVYYPDYSKVTGNYARSSTPAAGPQRARASRARRMPLAVDEEIIRVGFAPLAYDFNLSCKS